MLTSRWRAVLAACSVVLAAGCRGPTTYVHPDADIRDMRTVAVLPFENLSGDRVAAERVRELLVAELQARGVWQVVEPGLVVTAVSTYPTGTRTPEELKKIGESLHAEALFLGTVVTYREAQSRNGSEVALNLRLVDARSGLTLWSSSHTRNGQGFTSNLLGLPSETPTELARRLIREELKTLFD
jgi:TolB-like protein